MKIKTKYFKYSLYLPFLILILAISSCGNDDSPLLLNNSEQNLIGELKSMEVRPGANRVSIKGVVDDPNVSEVRIYWDDRSDSVVFPVNNTAEVDTIQKTIDNLEERLYVFEAQNFDEAGNGSKTISGGAEVYGSGFSGSAKNREVRSSVLIENQLDVTYGPTASSSGIIGTEFIYENASGEDTELFLKPENNSLSIPDFKSGSTYRYRSVFIPSLRALDTIYTEYDEFTPDVLPKIVFITDDSKDDEQIEWLRNQGFYVTTYYNASFGSAPQADVDMLNAADLIIVGRSGSSGDFADDQKIAWNALTVPLILNTQWVARSSRMNWFDHADNPVKIGEIGVVRAQIQESGDSVFEGVTIGGDNLLPWSNTPDDFLYINTEPNGDVLGVTPPGEAENEEGGAVLFVRFDAGTEFYAGAGESAAGPRTYFGLGTDADDGNSYYFPLTEEARQVYLNEINRMVNL